MLHALVYAVGLTASVLAAVLLLAQWARELRDEQAAWDAHPFDLEDPR